MKRDQEPLAAASPQTDKPSPSWWKVKKSTIAEMQAKDWNVEERKNKRPTVEEPERLEREKRFGRTLLKDRGPSGEMYRTLPWLLQQTSGRLWSSSGYSSIASSTNTTYWSWCRPMRQAYLCSHCKWTQHDRIPLFLVWSTSSLIFRTGLLSQVSLTSFPKLPQRENGMKMIVSVFTWDARTDYQIGTSPAPAWLLPRRPSNEVVGVNDSCKCI